MLDVHKFKKLKEWVNQPFLSLDFQARHWQELHRVDVLLFDYHRAFVDGSRQAEGAAAEKLKLWAGRMDELSTLFNRVYNDVLNLDSKNKELRRENNALRACIKQLCEQIEEEALKDRFTRDGLNELSNEPKEQTA